LVLAVVLPFILAVFLTNEYVEANLKDMYLIFIILFLQNIFVILEYPYGTVINQKLLFAYALKIKLLAFSAFAIFFTIYEIYLNNFYILLSLTILPSLVIFIAFKSKTLCILNKSE
jgi:hypothetical protein